MTLRSEEGQRVLYIEGDPALEVIVAALEAWGLRVRAEREQASWPIEREGEGSIGRDDREEAPAWVTRRPALPRVSRLENILSPLWFPVRRAPDGSEPVTAFSWFGRAA